MFAIRGWQVTFIQPNQQKYFVIETWFPSNSNKIVE